MPRTRTVSILSLGAVVLLATPASAQPRISNGQVSTRPAGTSLAETFRAAVASHAETGWIGYAVPVVAGERHMCCSNSGNVWMSGSVIIASDGACCSSCRLEPSRDSVSGSTSTPSTRSGGPVKLEASARAAVLFRVVNRAVERIRIFSEDCELDAGGRAVTWLENVRPDDSIALLESLAIPTANRHDHVSDGAISAIALHGDPAADAALDRLIAVNQPEDVRRKIPFWLGNARGAHGLEVLRRLLRDDPSAEVRKRAIFGVSQSREPGAFDTLANVARSGSTTSMRSEAVFWVAQTKDPKAQAVVQEVLEKDAAPEVRKKAVFALSQLDRNSGVDALINVARNNADASMRGEAIFWLGQKAGSKAASEITDRIDQDPDTEVKKKAVFALSQLPKDEGVPRLIQVARTNPNPAVRKQAMFWLGQSKDPRAIDFFAEILK
jgi:HEAT repeat protein